MSDQPSHYWVLLTLATGQQPRYEVKDFDAARELLNALSRQSASGVLIGVFYYGVQQEKVGAVQIDQIMYATTLIGVDE